MGEIHYCKYCYEEHDRWVVFSHEDSKYLYGLGKEELNEDLRLGKCLRCEHTSMVEVDE